MFDAIKSLLDYSSCYTNDIFSYHFRNIEETITVICIYQISTCRDNTVNYRQVKTESISKGGGFLRAWQAEISQLLASLL